MNTKSKYITVISLILLMTATLSATDYFRIKNRWTGEYLHIENQKGHLQLKKNINQSWHSAQWEKVNIGNGYFRLKNRWTQQYMHIEQKLGHMQLSKNGPSGGWHSSQWSKVKTQKGYFRLKNRWTKEYIHIEQKLGHTQLSKTGPSGGWWSSQWVFQKVKATPYRLNCRAGGNMGLTFEDTKNRIKVTFKAPSQGTRNRSLQPGECSWVDRGFRANEPKKFCQSNVKDIVLKINARSFSTSSRQAPYISKIKDGGKFSLKVHNNNKGCMVVDKIL